MFYLLSLLLYIKGRMVGAGQKGWAWFAASVGAGMLAVGTKEIAATLPFSIFLYEWYFFQDLDKGWLKRHVPLLMMVWVLLAILAFMYLGKNPLQAVFSVYQNRDFTPIQRVLTESRVVMYYVSLLVYPNASRLSLEHDFPLSQSLFEPIGTLFSAMAIVGMIGLAVYLGRKERLISFCILWFLGNLVIESSIIGLEIIFEHRTYLPSMFFFFLILLLAQRFIRRPGTFVAVVCAVALVFSYWTYERNAVWKDPVSLWRDCVIKAKNKARPHYNLGFILTSQGNLYDAIPFYREALRIRPDYAEAHNNLAAALTAQGKFDEAIGHLREALRIKPGYLDAHNNLGAALSEKGDLEGAIEHFTLALEIKPDYADGHANLGLCLARQGKLDSAVAHFLKALRINPEHAKAHNNLGVALAARGEIVDAVSHYEAALRLKPNYVDAHNNLGAAYLRQGKLEDARSHFEKTLQISPGHGEAHNGLGTVLGRQGKHEEAIAHFKEALRINPDDMDAQRNLERALAYERKKHG